MTPQLTDRGLFPLFPLVLWWLPLYTAPSSPTTLTRLYDHLQSLQPHWAPLFKELLQFWLQSYYSAKTLRVKSFIQVYTVNFHSLR